MYKRIDFETVRGEAVRGRWWICLAACLAVAFSVIIFSAITFPALGAPFGADPEEAEALLERLSDRYEVLTLSDSYVLQPTDPNADFRAIEIKAVSVRVDSEPVDRAELEDLVGEDAEVIFALAELGSVEEPGSAEGSATEELRGRIERMAEEQRLEIEEIEDLIRQRAEEIESLEEERLEEIETAREDERRAARERRGDRRRGRVRTDTRVSFGSSLTIDDNETSQDVVVLGGSLDVEGKVSGDATVVGGSADIEGEVSGTVTAVGGSIFLGPDAKIFGDALSIGGSVIRDPSAEIYGEITEVSLGPGVEIDDLWDGVPDWQFGWLDFGIGRLIARLAASLFLLAVMLLILTLFPRLTASVATRAEQEPWKAAVVGLGAQLLFLFALPVICVILIFTFVGIPLAIILFLLAVMALVVFFLLGFAGVATAGGRLLQRRFGLRDAGPYLLVMLGVLLIQGWSILGVALGFFGGPMKLFAWLMVLLGFVIKYVAWTIGLGSILLHRYSARPAGSAVAPLPPPPPETWDSALMDSEPVDLPIDLDRIDSDSAEPDSVDPDSVDPDSVDPDSVDPDSVDPDEEYLLEGERSSDESDGSDGSDSETADGEPRPGSGD